MSYGVTENGFVLKNYDAIIEAVKERAKLYFGDDVDLTDTSPIMEFANSILIEAAILWNVAEDVYYSAFIDFATGSDLDKVVALLGLTRKQATKATGIVTFSRSTPATNDIWIPLGTRVATADGSIVFVTTEGKYLESGNTSVDVAIEAQEAGSAGNVAANTITKIVDPISGIESVNNANATSGGSDTESDEALRYRAKRGTRFGKGTVSAIESAIAAVDGVTAVLVTEDTANHTASATVEGGADSDIDNAIEEARPAGIQVTWQRPTYVSVDVTVNATAQQGYSASTVQSNIEAAIDSYFSQLNIGEDVVYSDLLKAIVNAEGVDDVTSLSATDGATTIDALGESISISNTEKAQVGTKSVTVS
jgi:uncharacterized phage protein gp47/JayE